MQKPLRDIEVRALPSWWRGIECIMRQRIGEDYAVARNIELELIDPAVIVEPSFVLSRENAQILMDDLWVSGIRPTEAFYPDGALKATRAHLKDLQELVSVLLARTQI